MPAPKKKRNRSAKATVHDIAREANVSTGTVSRALNNSDEVKPETRQRVLEISRRLGIRPRAPKKRSHFAVIVPARNPNIPRPPVDVFVYELLNELSMHGSALSAFSELQMDELQRGIFDGIFCVNWQPEVIETCESIKNTPVIVLNRFQNQGNYSVVGWDHEAEGAMVANYFIERGHRKLSFLTVQPMNREANRLRLKGMMSAAEKAGVRMEEGLIEMLEDGSPLYAALQRLVDRGVDAIFVPGHGRFAMEVMNILQGVMRLKIPDDVSVIGADSPGWSLLTNPPLTGVKVPFVEITSKAVSLMFELIDKKKDSVKEERLLELSLVERKSVRDRTLAD